MQNLNLNDLLRYGFAGAVFILVGVFAFEDPGKLFTANKDITGSLAAVSTVAALTVGCVIYALHRAIPYPILYWLFKCLTGRTESTLDLDIRRWENASKPNALQPKLGDWQHKFTFFTASHGPLVPPSSWGERLAGKRLQPTVFPGGCLRPLQPADCFTTFAIKDGSVVYLMRMPSFPKSLAGFHNDS